MPGAPMREPEHIHEDCVRKLLAARISPHVRAVLGSLLNEPWSKPRLVEVAMTADGHLLGRSEGDLDVRVLLGTKDDLIRQIHAASQAAGLDGDEIGYLMAKVAEIKREKQSGM